MARCTSRASVRRNGIVMFDKPWKNVIGTLYHELNEFRIDRLVLAVERVLR
jgi:hypothetical protein